MRAEVAEAQNDLRWMRRALRLATKGFTPPNPMVGCVLVKAGIVVGEGYHPVAGEPHAEVFALWAAGELARGATAYVTLEPHGYWGKTPPCTEALIAAGVVRVVSAIADNNPKVSGKGFEALRAAGIVVEVGLEEAKARKLNEAFFHFHETGRPFVTLKAAMTLDGKIATATGDSKWITGLEARCEVHRLRAQSGAVMVGIGTLLQDDAQLTARLPGTKLPRQPLRIVVDSRLRTPPDCQAVTIATQAPEQFPFLIATTEQASQAQEQALRLPGVEVLRLPTTSEGRVDLNALCAYLGERQIISVLVEGGGELHASLIAERLAHKLLFFVAPKLLGGRDAPTPLEGQGLALMSAAVPVERLTLRRFGQDVALEGYLTPKEG